MQCGKHYEFGEEKSEGKGVVVAAGTLDLEEVSGNQMVLNSKLAHAM